MHFFILLEEDSVSKVNLSKKQHVSKKPHVLLEFKLTHNLQVKNNNNQKPYILKINTRMYVFIYLIFQLHFPVAILLTKNFCKSQLTKICESMIPNILRIASDKNTILLNPYYIVFFPNKKSYKRYKLYLNILFNMN